MIRGKKVVVVMPAYNAAKTLEQTYREIPMDLVDEVILTDDHSSDHTVDVAHRLGIREVIRHEKNKGYGGNQKSCYNRALEIGADIVIMVHPDYQYTPLLIQSMAYMIANEVYPVALASRILGKGALRGGMPMIKYVSNRFLTFFENIMLNQKLSEYHTGYRAFSAEVLRSINYNDNSDDFIFDNEMLAQIFYAGYEIGEMTCPTKYFDDASSINLKRSTIYGLGVLGVSLRYRLNKWGWMKSALFHSKPRTIEPKKSKHQMKIVRTKAELSDEIGRLRAGDKVVGFVPTMGGLHDGHLSLVRRSKAECDYTVVSVFLNPTQFNDPSDLETYPHDTDEDIRMLEGAGVDLLFLPTADEMYDAGETAPIYNLGTVAEVMEGERRPGHFQGVVWVVSKLFRLVRPHRAYFGMKDFQQVAVIKRMVELSPDMSVEIVPCPIIREADGLAMSSRNRRLSAEERAAAPEIFRALTRGYEAKLQGMSLEDVYHLVVSTINAHPLLEVEYFSIVDGETLEDIHSWSDSQHPVGAITVVCGPSRLIDHIEFY